MPETHDFDGHNLENLHGWFDRTIEPRLQVEVGDRVVYRVRDAAWDDWTPGTKEPTTTHHRPKGAGHALAGPVWVEGAMPGDALAISVRELICRDWAFGVHRPGKAEISGILGGQPDDVQEDFLNHFYLNREAGVWRFNERITIPLAPFMGIFGVAPSGEGRTPTFRPGPHGGNIDCKELAEGATVFLPVFVPGALFSVGDGHGAQGDGEVDGAAIETGMDRLVVDFGLSKRINLKRPRAETADYLIFLAFDVDLDVAVLEATRDLLDYLILYQGLTRQEAYNLASIAVDFRITQVVDELKGVHAMLPKSLFADDPPTLLQ